MKQLLYFLIGVLISACLMSPFAHADCVNVASGLSSSDQIVGHAETLSEASAIAQSSRESGAGSDAIGTCSSGDPGWWDTSYQNIIINGASLVCLRNKYGCWNVSGVPVLWGPWYCASYGTQTACIIGDSDGDGIPDENDFYPDDEQPYLIRKIGQYKCAGSDIICAELWETSRGDKYVTGDIFEVDVDPLEKVYDSGWQTPGDKPISDDDFPQIGEPDVIPTQPDPVVADPEMPTGTPSQDTDTEAEKTTKTVDNTSKTVDGLGKIAGYGKSLDEQVKKMRAAVANTNRNVGDIEDFLKATKKEYKEEANQGKTDFENMDIDSLLGDDINGELVEGEDGDYQDHGKLIEETWVQELISSNPITTVLTNSGFEYSSGSPTATLNLGELGTHILDISDLEAGFIAFGNLLVSFTTLIGLVHVITGKGF